MDDALRQHIAQLEGSDVKRARPLSGGCIGEVYRVDLANGDTIVAKVGADDSGLAIEGWMLRYLLQHSDLPVPQPRHINDTLLLLEFIPTDGTGDASAQEHAAELLAALHRITATRYGLERDTLIGSISQPNPPSDNWPDFFAIHRLVYMARLAHDAGNLDSKTLRRVETAAAKLDSWLDEPTGPGLVHGDIWAGNMLYRHTAAGNRVAAFIDPAIYFAEPEIELAYITLFETFGPRFFQCYQEINPIHPGFFEVRRHVYNLYPLLTHACHFGGHYPAAVTQVLDRLGA